MSGALPAKEQNRKAGPTHADDSRLDLSVVIPSYNSEQFLSANLHALTSQQTALRFEIIVVDCSSHDDVKGICGSFPGVVFHREAERFNPGKGRNIGAGLAQGRLLVFVDADVVLDAHALQNAFDFHAQGRPIFGGALELNESTNPTVASYLEHYFFNHESQRQRCVQRRANLSSALMVFQRDVFLNEGGFQDIPRMQDTELTERLCRHGYELYFTPDVVGLQTQDSSISKVLRKIYINGQNLYFIRYADSPRMKKVALVLSLPLLSALKVSRIVLRHLRYQTVKNKLVTLAITPLLYLGGLYWMLGLYRSLLFGGAIHDKRD